MSGDGRKRDLELALTLILEHAESWASHYRDAYAGYNVIDHIQIENDIALARAVLQDSKEPA